MEKTSAPVAEYVAARSLRKRLLDWYRREKRDLPWRQTKDPYAIWVSEIMLQQTRVNVVLKYFEPFLDRFADVASLAGSSLSEVLGHWSGLGYYGRAVCLHKAARMIVSELDGRVPRDLAVLKQLPGVGSYTAAAIASLAFGKPVPALDANAKRVIRRLFRIEGEDGIERAATSLLPLTKAAEFNQAIMELGQTVCLPRRPKCLPCPLRKNCRTRGEHPERRISKVPKEVQWLFGLVRKNGKVLMHEREVGGLLGGLLDLPWVEVSSGVQGEKAASALSQYLRGELDGSVSVAGQILETRHAISGKKVQARLFECRLRRIRLAGQWVWVDKKSLQGLPLSSLTKRMLRSIFERTTSNFSLL